MEAREGELAPAQIAGLDTLRFAAAACVALGHGALFPFSAYVQKSTELSRIFIGIYNCAFNGTAAVIIFFVISGFCIHYSFARGSEFRADQFLVRRIFRIGVPVVAAWALAATLGEGVEWGLRLVLWSLYCEMVYYLLYPILRLIFKKVSLLVCVIVSFVSSSAIVTANPDVLFYWDFSFVSMILILLPVWLAGCLLAEIIVAGIRINVPGEIWIWRFAAWVYATSSLLWFYHGFIRIGLPLLLSPFYVFSFFWIYKEIRNFQNSGISKKLEWCGKWSYSLYLTHGIVMAALPYQGNDRFVQWLCRVAVIVAGALTFYCIVEYPSHITAQFLGRRTKEIFSKSLWNRPF